MPDRLRIPALALLGLSFTTCVDRAKEEDGDEDGGSDDPIVGEWFVNQIDGTAFPMSYSEDEGYNARNGWSMTVEPDLTGDFVYYFVYGYMGLETGQFYRLGLTIDASKAPEYRLEIPLGLFPFDGPDHPYTDDTGYSSLATITTYGSTYDPDGGTYDTDGGTYDTDVTSSTAPGTGTDTDATGTTGTTGSPLQADPVAPLAVPPAAAPGEPGTLILVCNLVTDDALDCQRERVADDPDAPLHWRFKRASPDKPTGI